MESPSMDPFGSCLDMVLVNQLSPKQIPPEVPASPNQPVIL